MNVNNRLRTIIVVVTILIVSGLAYAGEIAVVDQGKPTAVIVVGENPPAPQLHAARELQKYIQLISGALLPICSDVSSAPQGMTNQVLVGCTQTNESIQKLCAKGLVKLSADHPGQDRGGRERRAL